MHFQSDCFCSVATYDIIFCCRPVCYKTLILRKFTENTHSPAACIIHTKFDQACDVIFMVSK